VEVRLPASGCVMPSEAFKRLLFAGDSLDKARALFAAYGKSPERA
jgi:hypothetical protein